MHNQQENGHINFSINIIGKKINCTVPENIFMHGIFTKMPFLENPDSTIIIDETPGPIKTKFIENKKMLELRVSGEDVFDMNNFRSFIGFLVHKMTPALFLHGCGMYSIVKKKGILILGNKGSGKTTISKQIPLSYIIDDDQILIYGKEIINIGQKSAQTVPKNKIQSVVYKKTTCNQAELGIIFILSKDHHGGYYEDVSVDTILKDESLLWHHNLYSIKKPLNFYEDKKFPHIPAVIIGTNNNKRETIDIIHSKIESEL